jgi:CRISPR-associated protein Cmr1
LAAREWKCRALTDIWTGDASGRGDRLIATGLLGSIRWWFEVLVRGLGGKACDPTLPEVRCPAPNKTPSEPGHHCVVCELFGCTGWARKFRFDVLDETGQPKSSQIKAKDIFILRFTELRPIREEEWCLLDLTLRLIAEYGAIGGKTVFKPSDEQNRQNAFHHKDFGLISIEARPAIRCVGKEALEAYVRDGKWRADFNDRDFSWASLANFWCVNGRYLARQNAVQSTFNQSQWARSRKRVSLQSGSSARAKMSSHQKSGQIQLITLQIDAWLAGRQQESKKVFSFKEPPRTFGFVNPGLQDSNQRPLDFNEIRRRLKQVCGRTFRTRSSLRAKLFFNFC